MPEVVVVASFTAKDGREEEAERLLRGAIEPTHAESGCLLYALHRGTQDPRERTESPPLSSLSTTESSGPSAT